MMALSEWQEKEKQSFNCAVDEEGCLLDNLTLELRVHPPEIHIDNAGDPNWTVVTIDSANRPGSLVFVRLYACPERCSRSLYFHSCDVSCRLCNISRSWD